MNLATRPYHNPRDPTVNASPATAFKPRMSAVDFFPVEIVKRQTAQWRGLQAQTLQIIRHEPFEYRFKEQCHLLIATEQSARYDGETFVEGLPTSRRRDYSHKLVFIPAGRRFYGSQNPRLLTRSTCLYMDPHAVLVDPELRFAEVELPPRLFFEDSSLLETVFKLKAQIGSADPSARMYAEALGGVLAHELMGANGAIPTSRPANHGGLAGWQQKRVADFIEAHLAESISVHVLADLVRLSPYHFQRSFKRSFGEPPHRYCAGRRIERGKALLANPRLSVTEIALDVGFSETSAFSASFHRFTGHD
jgi:AraC family transcriptional regulator